MLISIFKYLLYYTLSFQLQVINRFKYVKIRTYPGSEFIVANTLAIWKKLEPNEFGLK